MRLTKWGRPPRTSDSGYIPHGGRTTKKLGDTCFGAAYVAFLPHSIPFVLRIHTIYIAKKKWNSAQEKTQKARTKEKGGGYC